MRFASLASGSGGNALIVETGHTRVMLDCGLTVRDTELRLARAGLRPEDLAAVVVTHEHDDHLGGVLPFAQKHGIVVYLTFGTWRATGPDEAMQSWVRIVDSHTAFAIDGLQVQPVPVPHDAREPVQYVFSDGVRRLAVLTDAGTPTRHMIDMMSGCEALVLECNHDGDMLAGGPYPGWLKARIGGPFGHLSNRQSAELLGALDCSRMQHLVAAHLSASNNTPQLARTALAAVLGCSEGWVAVADQKAGLDWRDVR
jgi:phosphoribosyl 1,2-cyclic phosphodiesterase